MRENILDISGLLIGISECFLPVSIVLSVLPLLYLDPSAEHHSESRGTMEALTKLGEGQGLMEHATSLCSHVEAALKKLPLSICLNANVW